MTASAATGTSNAVAVKVAARNFGPVTNLGSAGGAALGRTIPSDGSDPTALSLGNAAETGSTIEIDATGLGPIESADNELPSENNLEPGALLVIGGVEIPVAYLGRNPGRPGFDRQ